MQLLASCDLETAKGFNGKLVLPNEDTEKPDKVSLNIVINSDCFTEIDNLSNKNVACVTIQGTENITIPDKWVSKVFRETTLENLDSIMGMNLSGIPLVRLQEGYSDMRTLFNISKKYPTVRFIGGSLLQIEGICIGRFDDGKDKLSPYCEGMYDRFVEVSLSDLDGLQEIVKKQRKKAESSTKEKKPRAKKVSSRTPKKKLTAIFNTLFSEDEEDEF